MFDFLVPVSIFGFGGYFLYKIFELYGMRNERMTIIERLEMSDLVEYVKRLPIGVGGGSARVAEGSPQRHIAARWPLRWGLMLLGFGAGVICGNIIAQKVVSGQCDVYSQHYQFETVWLACTTVGIGVGLLASFVVETIIAKTSKD